VAFLFHAPAKQAHDARGVLEGCIALVRFMP